MLPSFLGWMGLTLNVGPRWEGSLAPGSLLPQLLIKSRCWFLVWPLTVQHELQLPNECGLRVLHQLLFLNRECSWESKIILPGVMPTDPVAIGRKGRSKISLFPSSPLCPLFSDACILFLLIHRCQSLHSSTLCSGENKEGLCFWPDGRGKQAAS